MNSESESLMKSEQRTEERVRNDALVHALGLIAERMVESARVGTREEAKASLVLHLADVFSLRESHSRIVKVGQEILGDLNALQLSCEASGMVEAAGRIARVREEMRDAVTSILRRQ